MPALRRPAAVAPAPVAAAVGVPLTLAGVLLAMAMLVAPEQPAHQEAICQRHNGVAACRVW